MNIGYARVSSDEQSLDIQIQQLTTHGCEKIFEEKISGKSADRGELHKLLGFAREGDVVHVCRVDRLARNTVDALQIADTLNNKGAGLIAHDLGDLDINSDIGRVIYTTIAAFAQLERKRILQRCNEGRARAKQNGVHLGRLPNLDLHARIKDYYERGHNKRQIALQLNCSRTTVYRVLAQNSK
jgi:DNA invertase Pin-like site-specific DNA recombinase